ncbi:Uncharacterized protein PBTT_01454 [Plasmodiophora brassicae]|uniref:Uncharacterized protein n=1 Tax=Plasmodiophora brassicae TaxID=37360 RepID=A0A0G4IIF6_PLABS|nr:hypothetical protein PBRA_003675 [Plasmodiophora brassicae]SPQ94193.1 unnamed protein product [Plasmodiophora brassicae]
MQDVGALDALVAAVTDYSSRCKGSAVKVLQACPTGSQVHFEWTPPNSPPRDVYVRLLTVHGQSNALTIRAQARYQVPHDRLTTTAILMNILNQNCDCGSFRVNMSTGHISYVVSAFHNGTNTADMTSRFMKEIDLRLDTFLNICLLNA